MDDDDNWSEASSISQPQDAFNRRKFQAKTERFKVCVVGSGFSAGLMCQSLVKEFHNAGLKDFKDQIVLISRDPFLPYDKTSLHSSLLVNQKNKMSFDGVNLDDSIYEKKFVSTKLGYDVARLDYHNSSITIVDTSKGTVEEIIFYEKIIFAPELEVVSKPLELEKEANLFSLNTKSDVFKVVDKIKALKTPSIVVIGDSIEVIRIGFALSTWLNPGSELNVVCGDDGCFKGLFSKEDKSMLQDLAKKRNVRLHFNTMVKMALGYEFFLSNSEKLRFNVGIYCGNLRPENYLLFREIGLEIAPPPDFGIKTNDRFEALGKRNIYVSSSLASITSKGNNNLKYSRSEEAIAERCCLIAQNISLKENKAIVSANDHFIDFGENASFYKIGEFSERGHVKLGTSRLSIAGEKLVGAVVWNANAKARTYLRESVLGYEKFDQQHFSGILSGSQSSSKPQAPLSYYESAKLLYRTL